MGEVTLSNQIGECIELGEKLRAKLNQAKKEAKGYDLLRYLKRAEAEVMDLLHNLSQAKADLPKRT